MVLQIDQILRALRRHRASATIIALAIALATAILSNSMFNVATRLQLIATTTGLAEDQLAFIAMTGEPDKAGAGIAANAISQLRSITGVSAATISNVVPFGGINWTNEISTGRGPNAQSTNATQYMVSEDGIKTFGLYLLAGRDFNPEEYVNLDGTPVSPAAVTLLSRDLAEKLFENSSSAVGQLVYVAGRSYTVVGVIDKLASAYPSARQDSLFSMVFPTRVASNTAIAVPFFTMRCDASSCERALKEAQQKLKILVPRLAVLKATTIASARSAYFAKDRDAIALLVAVSALLLLITALGIIGLASFWVQQRKRQIGVRRALGATKGDIVRYFQVENFLVVTMGVVLGMIGALGVSLLLMQRFETSALPWWYLPIAVVVLWLLGQLAVLAPALQAAKISPIEATRSSG